jgi:hypothetical protein
MKKIEETFIYYRLIFIAQVNASLLLVQSIMEQYEKTKSGNKRKEGCCYNTASSNNRAFTFHFQFHYGSITSNAHLKFILFIINF